MKNFVPALIIALVADMIGFFQWTLVGWVVADVIQIPVTAILYYLTRSPWMLIVFLPEEALPIVPFNTLAVIAANNKGLKI